VHFPTPTPQPYTISREFTDAAPAGTPAPAATPAAEQRSDPSHPPANGEQQGHKQMEPEELYEYFLDRFRRDLLIEREQLGHLIIDNP
jgi:hypothetical protein